MPSRPDTTVKYFESTQTGAPVLSGTAGALIAVLDAVLVNGFGLKTVDAIAISGGYATLAISTGHGAIVDGVIEVAGVASPGALNGPHRVKSITANSVTIYVPDLADGGATGTPTMKIPGAGWTKVLSKTDVAVYKSANAAASGLVIRIDDTGAQTARWRGYETMTDVDTGSGAFPPDTQLAGGQYIDKSSAASAAMRNWSVVANDRAVYLGIDHHSPNTIVREFAWTFFGDIVSRRAGDAYRFAVFGGTSSATNSRWRNHNPACWWGLAEGARAIARSYGGLGSSASIGLAGHYKAFDTHDHMFGEGYGTPFPNPTDNALILGEVSVIEKTNTILRGKMPGCYAPAQVTMGGIVDATPFDGIPELPGRRLLAKLANGISSGATAVGHVLFDVTGPWEY